MHSFDCFDVAALPRVIFGSGRISELAGITREFGCRALVVTGAKSFCSSVHWQPLVDSLAAQHIRWDQAGIDGEPSPSTIDDIVTRFSKKGIDVVIGIGGGSTMDGAKAIAGLLPSGNSVMDYLEGVGRGVAYQGPATPLIAVPTTAGTGSEATKNAVLSRRGDGGFKKSFRHPSLVARVALLDPDLMKALPQPLMATQAMDAITQLIESYVSVNASPFTDVLALSGIEAARDGLFTAVECTGKRAAAGRAAMMYAAFCSGITLAQAGLGVVHCLASPLGAFFPIPHGAVCGTLLGAATRVNIESMQSRDPENPALPRYARISSLFSQDPMLMADEPRALTHLVDTLDAWIKRLDMPFLSTYGVRDTDFPRIVAGCQSGSKATNPVALTDSEMTAILAQRI
jgi:alcohol dehydrogenase